MTENNGRFGGRAFVVAAAALAMLAGCEDKQARQQSDEQVTALRRERDEFESQLDRTRVELKETRAQLVEKYGNALNVA
ncbi:MAG: hypothetical protein PHU85_07720, partial [Phycisphaerae bacterium]|nr:hypothetical protein [Phycisphaerae bacterium]